MYVRTKTTPNSPRKSVQIVECIRNGDKVSQKIVRYVGIAANEREEDELKKLAESIIVAMKEERQPRFPGMAAISETYEKPLEEKHLVNLTACRNQEQVVEGFSEVFGNVFHQMGFAEIFGSDKQNHGKTNALLSTVFARLASPMSKLASSDWLEEKMGIDLSVDRIYRMMDGLAEREGKVKEIIARRTLELFGGKVALMLYDVTTLYFESFEEDELRKTGYSKDNKIKETQIVLGLATTKDGQPLWYEVFPGNTWEGHTLLETLKNFGEQFKPEEIVIVADRGMFARVNLETIESLGYRYVLGAKLKSLSKKLKSEVLDSATFEPCAGRIETEENFQVKLVDYDATSRLVVSWSSKRAKKDEADREKLIERTKAMIGDSSGVPSNTLLKNRGTKRYLRRQGKDTCYVLDEAKIAEDRLWDGLHGLITNIPDLQNVPASESNASIEGIFAYYRSLWRIEESFRLNKHDLRLRPIYHWNEARIRAHVSICYIAYAMARKLEYQIKLQRKADISFDRVRDALLDVESAILLDRETNRRYRLPKEMSQDAAQIYAAMGIKRSMVPTEITSLQKYHHRSLLR